jgi:Right handed beta helix region
MQREHFATRRWVHINMGMRCLVGLFTLTQLSAGWSIKSKAEVSCGQTITVNTVLDADLACPPGIESAIVIGASNITLDLGGHKISGSIPTYGVFAINQEGITIRNGTLEGFNYGVFLINTRRVTAEHLTIRNLAISDPGILITGMHILNSREVVVRDSVFEFLTVAHKEAVEIYASSVDVSDIEVRGGGAGVSFSYAGGTCDPVNSPSNGTVRNSTFSDIYTAGIWIACSSHALIEGNNFIPAPDSGIGIQADAPFLGAVTGLTIRNNSMHAGQMGIEFRGITQSSITNNHIYTNQIWGIAIRQSLGCIAPEPGWACAYSTANVIADNQTWGNIMDLYHHENSLGNTWEANTCLIKQGDEIPACSPPQATLTINRASGKPGSFFTLEGANFPANSSAIITANDSLLGTVPTDNSGNLRFLLNTGQADAGDYVVAATVNSGAAAGFDLAADHLIHAQEGTGTIFIVPGGITTHSVYLPRLLR